MTCSRFQEQISEYIDGEADSGVREEMEAHVAACPQCEGLVRDMVGLTDRLSRMPRVQPSAGFDFALHSLLSMEISREAQRPQHLWGRVHRTVRPFAGWATLAAAAVLVVAASAVFLMGGDPQKAPLQTADSRWSQPPPAQNVATVEHVLPQERGALKRLSEEESVTISDYRQRPVRALSGSAGVRRQPTVQRVAVRF